MLQFCPGNRTYFFLSITDILGRKNYMNSVRLNLFAAIELPSNVTAKALPNSLSPCMMNYECRVVGCVILTIV